MIINSKEKLFKLLANEIDNANGPIAIQAGHFALIYDEINQKLVPAIFEDIDDNKLKEYIRLHPYMGYFPLTTWKFGVSLAKYAIEKLKQVKLLILVNDWQWVPKVGFGDENLLRNNFYKYPKLPDSYKKELEKNNCGVELIMPFKNKDGKINNPLFFSEQKLRNQFGKYFYSCNLNNQCAGEYVPLILQIEKENVDLFISFIPKTCMNPIIMGSKKSKEHYNVKMKIINIFANGIFKNNFWENIEISVV